MFVVCESTLFMQSWYTDILILLSLLPPPSLHPLPFEKDLVPNFLLCFSYYVLFCSVFTFQVFKYLDKQIIFFHINKKNKAAKKIGKEHE